MRVFRSRHIHFEFMTSPKNKRKGVKSYAEKLGVNKTRLFNFFKLEFFIAALLNK